MEEIRFFELGDEALNKLKADEGIATEEEADEKPLPENPIQKSLWLMCEHPESGAAARVVAIGSVLVIVVSIVIFCLETLPRFKHYKIINLPYNRTKIIEDEVPSMTDPFFLTETMCIIWFSIELIIRFLASPSKMDFLKVSSISPFLSLPLHLSLSLSLRLHIKYYIISFPPGHLNTHERLGFKTFTRSRILHRIVGILLGV